MMTPYIDFIRERWMVITVHLYLGMALMYGAASPLHILILAPAIYYAYVAVMVDINRSGYMRVIMLTEEPDLELAHTLGAALAEESEADVQLTIITGEQLEALRDELKEDP